MRHESWAKATGVSDESPVEPHERKVLEERLRAGSFLCVFLYVATIAFAFSGHGYGHALFALFYVMLPAGLIGTIWSLFLLLKGVSLGGEACLIGAIPFALYAGSIALVFMGIFE